MFSPFHSFSWDVLLNRYASNYVHILYQQQKLNSKKIHDRARKYDEKKYHEKMSWNFLNAVVMSTLLLVFIFTVDGLWHIKIQFYELPQHDNKHPAAYISRALHVGIMYLNLSTWASRIRYVPLAKLKVLVCAININDMFAVAWAFLSAICAHGTQTQTHRIFRLHIL